MNEKKSACSNLLSPSQGLPQQEWHKNMQIGKGLRRLGYFVFAIITLVSAQGGFAADWFVRSTTTGANNGTDWNNAWSISGINWASVNPGDTIWLAGGTYTGSLNPKKSGVAGNLIYVKR